MRSTMPLSKAKNRDRMRQSRLHKHISPLYQSKPVQPKPSIAVDKPLDIDYVDADGNVVYEP